MYTVVLVFNVPPFFGVNVKLILAFSLLAWCFFKNACSTLLNVSLTVNVVAAFDDLDALLRPFPDAVSFPADGTLTVIVATLPLTLCLTTPATP